MKLLDTAPADAFVLSNDAEPVLAAGSSVHTVALQFPKWTDGRAYSQARLLRTRQAFKGDLVAVGDVLVDMLPLLHRTGFSAAVLRADQSPDVAKRVMSAFTAHYQADVHESRPAFARATAPAADDPSLKP